MLLTECMHPEILETVAKMGHGSKVLISDGGYPHITVPAQRRLMDRLLGKIRDNVDEIAELEMRLVDDADVLVLCYGSTSRAAWQAVKTARLRDGVPVGWVRMITAWPFPEERIAALSRGVSAILVPEINYGQMIHPIREQAQCHVAGLNHPGGGLLRPDEILAAIHDMARDLS